MFNQRNTRRDEFPLSKVPMTKLKNISCGFCRYRFYGQDLVNYKGPYVPLLLECGHAVCQQCANKRKDEVCLLCKKTDDSTGSQRGNILPVNVYVVGLMDVNTKYPFYADECNISFCRQLSTDQLYCNNCDSQAAIRCVECKTQLCHSCSNKIHNDSNDGGRMQFHYLLMLTDSKRDSIVEIEKCCDRLATQQYYCNDCEQTGCGDCMLDNHKSHNSVRLAEKNDEYEEDFLKVQDKLKETLERIRLALKKQPKVQSQSHYQIDETVEAAVNQHFAHLHGVLQNVERRMIDELYDQRDYTTRNLNELRQCLEHQERQVQSGLEMISAVGDMRTRGNLKDVISKLERLADMPCYLVEDPITDDEKTIFTCDSTVIKVLEDHCKIEVPQVKGYSLLKREALPSDYQLEPVILDETTTISVRSSSKLSLSQRNDTTGSPKLSGKRVHVCYIGDPGNFYVRLESHYPQVKKMEDQISSFVKNQLHPPEMIETGKLYAVKFGKRWCRVRVNAINTSIGAADTYELFHMDSGRTEYSVNKAQLRSIPQNCITLPQTVLNCSFNIIPTNGVWASGAKEVMLEHLEPENYSWVMCVNEIRGDTHYVDLISSSRGSVRKFLIFVGYGTFASGHILRPTSSLGARRFIRGEIDLNRYYNVRCSHVESPHSLWVQKAGDHLAELSNAISNTYNDISKRNQFVLYVPEIGMPCAIKKSEGVWCRGTISDIPAPKTVEVSLVDFGQKITTSHKNICKLYEAFMATTSQAIKVCLEDIQPCRGEKWSKEAIAMTKKCVEGKDARIVAFAQTELGYKVALYIGNDVNFPAQLTSSGLAISTGPRSISLTTAPMSPPSQERQKLKVQNSHTFKGKKKCNVSVRKVSVDNVYGTSADNEKSVDPYSLPVKIVRAESPDVIYLSNPDLQNDYDKMMADMQIHYEIFRETLADLEWEIDTLCVVYSKRDKKYCRGKIISIDANKEAQIFFIDLTFTEKFQLSELQTLAEKFWKTQAHAFKVKLGGISPCGGTSEWTSSSRDKLRQIVAANENSKFYITKVACSEKTLAVELWFEEKKIPSAVEPTVTEWKTINKILRDEGLALPIKNYKVENKMVAIELLREIGHEARKDIVRTEEDESANLCLPSTSLFRAISPAPSKSTLVSNEDIQSSWLNSQIITRDRFFANVTGIDDDGMVHLHSTPEGEQALVSIQENFNKKYLNTGGDPKDVDWKVGDICAVEYHDDRKWYRGQVTQIKENNVFTVEMIDYGTVQDCDPGVMIRNPILTDIPSPRIKCEIYGISPDTPTQKYRSCDIDRIHLTIVEKRCEIIVHERYDDYLSVSIFLLVSKRQELTSLLSRQRLHIKINKSIEQDAMGKLEAISLPDIDCDSYPSSKPLIFPSDTKTVKHQRKSTADASSSIKKICSFPWLRQPESARYTLSLENEDEQQSKEDEDEGVSVGAGNESEHSPPTDTTVKSSLGDHQRPDPQAKVSSITGINTITSRTLADDTPSVENEEAGDEDEEQNMAVQQDEEKEVSDDDGSVSEPSSPTDTTLKLTDGQRLDPDYSTKKKTSLTLAVDTQSVENEEAGDEDEEQNMAVQQDEEKEVSDDDGSVSEPSSPTDTTLKLTDGQRLDPDYSTKKKTSLTLAVDTQDQSNRQTIPENSVVDVNEREKHINEIEASTSKSSHRSPPRKKKRPSRIHVAMTRTEDSLAGAGPSPVFNSTVMDVSSMGRPRPTYVKRGFFQQRDQAVQGRLSVTGEHMNPFERGMTNYCYALTSLRALSTCNSFWDVYTVGKYTHAVSDVLDAVYDFRRNQSVSLTSRIREWSCLGGNQDFDGRESRCAVSFLKSLLRDVSTGMREFYTNIRPSIAAEAFCDTCQEQLTDLSFPILTEVTCDVRTIVDGLEERCCRRLRCRYNGCDGSGAAICETSLGRLLIVSQVVPATGVKTTSYEIPQFQLVAVVVLLLNGPINTTHFERNNGHYVVGLKQTTDMWSWYNDGRETAITSVWQDDVKIFGGSFISQRIFFYSRCPKFIVPVKPNISIFTDVQRHQNTVLVSNDDTSETTMLKGFRSKNKTYEMIGQLYQCKACEYSSKQSNNVARHVKSRAINRCLEHLALIN